LHRGVWGVEDTDGILVRSGPAERVCGVEGTQLRGKRILIG